MPEPTVELSEQHQIFVAEYLVEFNATKAAIKAGYAENSARGQGCRLLANANIARAIREGVRERAEKLSLTADDIILRLLTLYERSMQAEPVMEFDYEAKCMKPTGEYVFDGKSAAKALELLGKHLKMFDKAADKSNGELFNLVINLAQGQQAQVIEHQAKVQPPAALPSINLEG